MKKVKDVTSHDGLVVGSAFLFHTHLGIWLGRINALTLDEVTLDDCSWVADQGRMGECVRNGKLVEAEFIGAGVVVPRNSIKVPWRHSLPTADL